VFDDRIEEDTKYTYRVISINSTGTSDPSNEISITLHTPPNPPRNVTATIGDGTVTINWIQPIPRRYSPVINYNITILVDDEWVTPFDEIDANTTSYVYNGINGEEYVFRLRASNEYGESEYVEITRTPGRAPDPPENVDASFVYNNVSIAWDEPAENGGYQIIRYRIFRSEDSGEFIEIAYQNYLTHRMIDENVEPGVEYEYYVTAENQMGRSQPSNSSIALTSIIYDPPPAPEIYLTTKGILYIKIHWRMPEYEGPPLTKFVVISEWSEIGPKRNFSIDLEPDKFSYNDTDIQFDVNYTYRVIAVNEIGESESSNLIDIRVRNLTEPPPNETVKQKKGNRALIFGLVAGLVIILAAGVAYFVITKRGPYDLPPEEFELDPEELNSSIDANDRRGS
jgi:hypothetical protein